jgi:hypothetical protein
VVILPWFIYSVSPQVPDVNGGKPWSAMDVADLKAAITDGSSLRDTAKFLCRSEEEVRAKATELGFELVRSK